jgi:peptide/nickel transport system substrate-binding protein
MIAAVAWTTAGCGGGPAGGPGGPRAVLDVGIPTVAPAPDDNNPLLPASAANRLGYGNLIYEPLVMPDPVRPMDAGTPWLASAWVWSPDGTTLTVTVRDHVRFSDGRPLTAADVAYTFGLLRAHPALNPDGVGYGDIRTNGNTVTVTFTAPPDAHRADILDTEIVPEHIWSTIADPTTATVHDPVGTGPFRLTKNDGSSVVLDVRADYWRALPAVQEVRYTAYPNTTAVDLALITGGSDWSCVPLSGVGADHLREWFPTPEDGGSYSLRRWFGWPDANNPYAPARPTGPTALVVVLRLFPAL